MQRSRVSSGFLKSVIHLPSSKSYANRALILAALKKNKFTVKNVSSSTDVLFLISALKDIGLNISSVGNEVTIENSFPECESGSKIIDVGDGGTTARFLASLLLRGKESYRLILQGRLKDRPWNEFLRLARSLGAKAELNKNELFIQGPMSVPDRLEVDCSETTQFASGMQLALAFDQVKVHPLHLLSSQSYWNMTEWMIDEIKRDSEFSVPLDWSGASYPLAFGGTVQKISLPGLRYDPFQADSKFLDVLKKFGCIEETKDGIIVSPAKNSLSIDMDISDALDLVPALAFFLSYQNGRHILRGTRNLVFKESDRLKGVHELLKIFSKESEMQDDLLIIHGNTKKVSEPLDLTLSHDHRMVMTGTLFLLLNGGGSVAPSDAVSKSFPDFFQLLT